MKSADKPWARKAFELIFHAEHHWRRGHDYDKRLALISFDNAIEVSISVYLGLNPMQRENRHYRGDDVQKWLRNYHTKLGFFREELNRRGLPEHRDIEHIKWFHDQRNEIYHGSSGGVPELITLEEIRFSALWIYSVLFEAPDIEAQLNNALEGSVKAEAYIPQDLAKPSIGELTQVISDPEKATVLMGSSLIGKWDEGNPADMVIVKRLTDEL